jgi:hypothetical protein
MALPKAALLRGIHDDIPLDILNQLESTYITPEQINAVATEAVGGDDGDDTSAFSGFNRYMFVGDGHAFIDPSGVLVHDVRDHQRAMRRTRGADPVALKAATRTAVQKQTIKIQPGGM